MVCSLKIKILFQKQENKHIQIFHTAKIYTRTNALAKNVINKLYVHGSKEKYPQKISLHPSPDVGRSPYILTF